MLAAHVELGEYIFIAGLVAMFVEIDHGAADVEESDDLLAVSWHFERMNFARRLIVEVTSVRDSVVLAVEPASFNYVGDDDYRMAMPRQHAPLPDLERVAPVAGNDVKYSLAEPDVLGLRHPFTVVLQYGIGYDFWLYSTRRGERCSH